MQHILEVQNLSKVFLLPPQRRTLFKLFKRAVAGMAGSRKVWALKDINFELGRGEHIGLIGNNGAGKTTLLRIIAGIYKHTSGIVKIHGSMIGYFQSEIGMDRELMVLDNIYLFGAILGMDRKEINKRLEAIIDFSGLKDFIYLPLRDLSTGMMQRLAIAIVRESDAEILFLDEMLSAGDLAFQEKCFNEFDQYKKKGKSLIAATHNLDLIERVCDKALLLDHGRQVDFGPAKEIVARYRKTLC